MVGLLKELSKHDDSTHSIYEKVYLKDSVDLDDERAEDESEGEMEAEPSCGTEGIRGLSDVDINTDIGQLDTEQNQNQHVPCRPLQIHMPNKCVLSHKYQK